MQHAIWCVKPQPKRERPFDIPKAIFNRSECQLDIWTFWVSRVSLACSSVR